MWCDDLDQTAGLRDSMQLIDEAQHVGHMFDNVATDDLIEFVVAKRIRKESEIVNQVGLRPWVRVDADCAGKFILATAYVQNLARDFGGGGGMAIDRAHECVS